MQYVVKVKATQIQNAVLIFLYKKKTVPQFTFKINWITKSNNPKALYIELGEKTTMKKDIASKIYKTVQTPRNTCLGGVIGDFFKLL